MVKKKVLEHLVDKLVDNGFDTFFLVTGGAIVPTVDYVGRKEGATYYCFQHEQSAAMAAESFYRTSGKMGVVLTTSGPGAQNLLNGICGCWYESVPCLFITGQVSTYESLDSIFTKPRQVGFQETPVAESFKHFTKFSTKVTKAELFENALETAIKESLTGRPGPVLIDLPVDIQNATLSKYSNEKIRWWANMDKIDLSSELAQIKSKLKESKRPLILLGQGVKLSGAQTYVKQLIDRLQIPFVVSWGGFDTVPHDHPLFVGDIGVYGSRGGNYAIQNCDFLLSIGSRLDTRQTGGQLQSFSRNSYKVMVDIDPNEVYKDRGIKIDLPIVCDAREFITSFIGTATTIGTHTEWEEFTLHKWKNLQEERELKDNILTSYEFLEELNTHLPKDSIIIPDEGGNLVWSMQSIKIKGNQKLYSNFGNSSMGYGLPSAIGAAIAKQGPVVCIDGDGGFQMNIQELQTVKHYNLPIKIFIMNNDCYGIIKQFQDSYFDKRYIATESQDYTAPDFVKVAEAYGIKAVRATKENYKEVISLAIQEEGSILVDVAIDREQKLIPKLEYGNPLEDMSPYQTDKEIEDNMLIEMIPRRDNTQGWVTLNK